MEKYKIVCDFDLLTSDRDSRKSFQKCSNKIGTHTRLETIQKNGKPNLNLTLPY